MLWRLQQPFLSIACFSVAVLQKHHASIQKVAQHAYVFQSCLEFTAHLLDCAIVTSPKFAQIQRIQTCYTLKV